MEPVSALDHLSKEQLIERCLHLQDALQEMGTDTTSWIEDLTRIAITNQNMTKSLTKGLQLILRASHMDGGYLHILNPEDRLLKLRACLGLSKTAEDDLRVIREGEKIPGQVLQRAEALIATNITEISDLSGRVTQERRRMLHAGFPLVWEGTVLGTLTVVSKSQKELSEGDLAILRAFSQFLAVVVQNSNLFDTVCQSKKQWEDAVDSVSDLVVICDRHFRILKTNKTIFERFQLPLEDAIGKECFELFYNGQLFSVSREKLERMLKRGVTYHEEVAPPRWNGIFSIVVSPIMTFGSLAGSIHVIKEITHQRLLEKDREELAQKVSLFAAGTITIDSSGRIQSWDAGASNILGYEREKVNGKALSTMFPSIELEDLIQNMRENRGLLDLETIAIARGRGRLPVSLTLAAQPDVGEKSGKITIFVRDIAHEAEENMRLIHSSRLTAMKKAVSSLSRKVGDRLESVMGQIASLEGAITEPNKIKANLERMIVEARSVQEVLNQVRLFSEERTDKELKPLESAQLIRDIIEQIHNKWNNVFRMKGIDLKLNPDQRTLPSTRGNSRELLDVFDHLIRNSVEAMPNGGKIILRTRTDRKWVNIAVIDDGTGMTLEETDRAFDPFFTTHPENLGLGLTIVDRIIRRHHGEVKLLSQINQGTQVTVRLPTIAKVKADTPPTSTNSRSPVEK